jgi:hypothetical protein
MKVHADPSDSSRANLPRSLFRSIVGVFFINPWAVMALGVALLLLGHVIQRLICSDCPHLHWTLGEIAYCTACITTFSVVALLALVSIICTLCNCWKREG